MPAAEARIPTERASRYLVQFCRHTSQMGRMRHQSHAHDGSQTPPPVEHAEWSGTTGTVRFAQGRVTLVAGPDALTVRVDAGSEDALRRLQDGIARRLTTIGRRDQLTITWRRPEPVPDPARGADAAVTAAHPAQAAAPGQGDRKRHRSLVGNLILAAAAVLAVAVHAGVLGGALRASAWAGWAANVVVAIMAVNVIIMGARLLRRRPAGRGHLPGAILLAHFSPRRLPRPRTPRPQAERLPRSNAR